MNLIGERFFWYRYRVQCDRGFTQAASTAWIAGFARERDNDHDRDHDHNNDKM